MTLFKHAILVATVAIICLAWPAVGSSQSISSARAQYAAGDFAAAAKTARALETFDGNLVAAAALTALGEYFTEGEERRQVLLHAIQLSQEAAELQSDSADAQLYLARAMGRYAQSISPAKALSEGYGEKVKEILDAVLKLDPNSWEAHASLGSWHSEIIANGGFLAAIAFGASRKKAMAHYAKAVGLAPDTAVVHLEVARGLHKLSETENRTAVVEHLERAVELPPGDAYDRLVRKAAAEMLAGL